MHDRGPRRAYHNHHIVTANWEGFVPRDDDIVIATPAKGGTTWTQAIIANLLFPDGLPAPPSDLSPWVDFARRPVAEVHALLAGQTHRRFIKTHLPADGLPLFAAVKYVVVVRDGRKRCCQATRLA
jgi:aryl sulfotransferase